MVVPNEPQLATFEETEEKFAVVPRVPNVKNSKSSWLNGALRTTVIVAGKAVTSVPVGIVRLYKYP